MRERNGVRYIIKVFEAQWDQLHDETVKPFFGQLKRDTNETYLRRNGVHQDTPGHDALFSYVVFQNAEGLKDALYRYDQGVDQRRKIAYFACHGQRGVISAVRDISRRRRSPDEEKRSVRCCRSEGRNPDPQGPNRSECSTGCRRGRASPLEGSR